MTDRHREWDMNLNPVDMDRMEKGTKQVEARLNMGRWRDMKVGDIIIFHADKGLPRALRMEVVDLLQCQSFAVLFTVYDSVQCNGKTIEEQLEWLLKDYGDPEKGYYTGEEEAEHGVLGILMRPVDRG